MRDFVVLAVLICVINAFQHDTPAFWYSNTEVIDNTMSIIPMNSSIENYLRSMKKLDFNFWDSDGLRAKLKSKKKLQLNPRVVSIAQFKKLTDQRVPLRMAISLKKKLLWNILSKNVNSNCPAEVADFECNRCVCVTPKLHICSSNVCVQTVSNAQCVEGTKVITKDCNQCLCFGGRGLCSLIGCPIEKKVKGLASLKRKIPKRGAQCKPGQTLKIDSCNTCSCFGHTFLCTLINCKFEREMVKMKAPNKLDVCQERTWYSASGGLCKHCLCLDNNVSYCFIGICPEQKSAGATKLLWRSRNKYSGGAVVLSKPSFTDDYRPSCEEGDSYSIGTHADCYVCNCQRAKWTCAAKKSTCDDYDPGLKQKLNSIFVNSKGPCSSCYRLKTGTVCASDLKCANDYFAKAKPISRCKNKSDCSTKCYRKNKNYGVCENKKCICF